MRSGGRRVGHVRCMDGGLRFGSTEYLPADAAGTVKWDCDEIMVWCMECTVDWVYHFGGLPWFGVWHPCAARRLVVRWTICLLSSSWSFELLFAGVVSRLCVH